MNDESILISVKKLLGIEPDYMHFDLDLITHINSVLSVLYQLGIGKKSFAISDSSSTWSDLLGDNFENLNDVKTYVVLRVRLMFDPPSNSSATESFKEIIKELEWRINTAVDPGEKES